MHISAQMLPPATEGDSTQVFTAISPLSTIKVEPVGRWYEAYCHRRYHKHTLSHHSLISSSSDESAEDLSEEEDEDEGLLLTLDPKEWKHQDHYAVLGLAKVRYQATEERIKRAYKKKVLKHHPDKRKARGLSVKDGDDDYFTCITRAYETLGNPLKRRAYDSVDPLFDDSVPSFNDKTKENFFEVFSPVFDRNERWSTKKRNIRVPKLGDDNATLEEVNKFYGFWYDFDSWREYSYLDEEEKEKGENREERRWIEKQNKAARQKRKKEELARIRQLVDNAYAYDPRILKFKEEEKEKKASQKRAKKEAAKAKADEEERIKQEALDAERQKKQREDEEARAQAAVLKKEKEAQKKVLKKERKTLRTAIKDFNYFTEDKDEDGRLTNMTDVDKLSDMLSLASLQSLNEALTSGDVEKAKAGFEAKVKEMNDQLEEETQRHLAMAHKPSSSSHSEAKSKTPWGQEETQMLIKAVNLFPAGTVARWETVNNFIKQHIPESNRTAKEVLGKAKDLQKMDPNMKAEANTKAFEKFAQVYKGAGAAEKSALSERLDSVAEQQISETGSNPAPWSAEEQKLLEQSLKTYPANSPERWDKIAGVINTRSRKDCMRRYKELVEIVRAKKAAQAAVKK